MDKRTVQSTTTTSVETQRAELAKALRSGMLSRDEELVLRMRHGIAEPASAQLSYRGQDIPEVAAKLAMIEADLLARMRPQAADDASAGEGALKAHIIERLKRL